jgi:hypothetical protein
MMFILAAIEAGGALPNPLPKLEGAVARLDNVSVALPIAGVAGTADARNSRRLSRLAAGPPGALREDERHEGERVRLKPDRS